MNRVMTTLIHLSLIISIFLLYTLLHEGGHAITAILFGGKITEFDINFLTGDPHVRYSGQFSSGQRALISLFGPLLPIIIWGISIFTLSKANNIIVKKTLLLSGVCIIFAGFPNIILPVLYELGHAVEHEDIVKFIMYSGINSYLVAFINLGFVILIGTLIILKLEPVNVFKTPVQFTFKNKKMKVIGASLSGILFMLLIVSSINLLKGALEENEITPPDDAEKIVHIDFALDGKKRVIYEFEVTEANLYEFHAIGDTQEELELSLESNVHIRGSRINSIPVYKNTGYKSGMMSWYLDEGTYRLVIEEPLDYGTLDVYSKTREFNGLRGFTDEDIFNENLPTVPSDYTLVHEGTITNDKDVLLYDFTIEEGDHVFFTIFLTTRTGVATINVVGDGVNDRLISPHQIMTDARGTYLVAGDYKLELTASDCEGKVFIYMKH